MDRKRVLPILLVVFSNIVAAGMVEPVLPLFAQESFGSTSLQATLLLAIFFAAQFVAAPFLGRLSDRVGRRPVLIASQIGTMLSFLMLYLSIPLGGMLDNTGLNLGASGGLLVLYAARILDGATFGNITVAQAYITDVSPEESRAHALGLLGAIFGLGFVFGPAIGAWLASFDVRAPFMGGAIMAAVTVVLTSLVLNESLRKSDWEYGQKHPYAPLGELLRNPQLVLLILIVFLLSIPHSSFRSTISLFASHALYPGLDAAAVSRRVGLMLSIFGAVVLLSRAGVLRVLVRRMGEHGVVILSLGIMTVTYAGIAATVDPIAATVLMAIMALGTGLLFPSLQALFSKLAERGHSGRMLGLFQAARSPAFIIGPILGGYAFDAISPQAPFLYSIPLLVLSVALAVRLSAIKRNEEHQTS